MSSPFLPPPAGARDTRQRIVALRRKIAAFQYVCSGTLVRKTLPCGKQSCACKKDPDRRHGPYYYWHHLDQGRLICRVLSPTQVMIVRLAVENHKRIKRILKKWERETVKVIRASKDAARRKK